MVPGSTVEQHDSNETVPSPSKLLGGLLLILIGLIFLAQQHDWLFGWHVNFSRLWPLLLIVIGIVRLAGAQDATVEASAAARTQHLRRRAHSLRSGAWFLFLGAVFLLHTNDIFRLNQTWPLFIVWAGVMILLNRHRTSTGPTPDEAPPPGSAQP